MSKQSEYQQQLCKTRKENNLCVWCGKPLDREGAICQACANKSKERSKERRDYLLKIGVCPVCGKRPITTGGYKSCVVCRTHASDREKNLRTKEKSEHLSIYYKQKRTARESQGLCTVCGKNKAEPGFKTCLDCRKKKRKYNHIYVTKYTLSDRELWKGQGRCARCGSEDMHEASVLCEKCYQNSCKALEKARAVSLGNKAKKRAEQEEAVLRKSHELMEQFKPKTLWDQRQNPKQKIRNRRKKDKQGEQIR